MSDVIVSGDVMGKRTRLMANLLNWARERRREIMWNGGTFHTRRDVILDLRDWLNRIERDRSVVEAVTDLNLLQFH